MHDLALTYVSDSSVIRYFSDLGVNLDPFYKLLWRHVLTVEVFKRHFPSHLDKENGSLWTFLSDRFSGQSRQDKTAKQAIQYLQKWDEKFWLEVDYRVKEITGKMEKGLAKQLEGQLRARVLGGGALRRESIRISEEQRVEVVNRGQRVVSDSQVQDLTKVQELLKAVLTDRQKRYYILIDGLDEDWVEEPLRYRLIMALLDAVREISKVPHVKALVAIRRDLIDRVFRIGARNWSGFFRRRSITLFTCRCSGRPKDLMEVLDRRVGVLVARRYQKNTQVGYRDVMPRSISGRADS